MSAGVLHTFHNPTDAPARLISVYSPSGFEKFFRDFGVPTATADGQTASVAPEMVARLMSDAAKYGMEIPPPPSVAVSEDFYCKSVLSGRVPVRIVAESARVLAFEHTRPTWEVHIVIIPKQHIGQLVEVGDASLFSEIFELLTGISRERNLARRTTRSSPMAAATRPRRTCISIWYQALRSIHRIRPSAANSWSEAAMPLTGSPP